MQNVIRASRLALKLAINDVAQHGLDSSHGFKAFFKTEENMYKVYSVLLNIETGQPSAHHTSPTVSKAAPSFVCITPEVTSIPGFSGYNLYEYCQSDNRVAAYARPSRYILLCEAFWEFPVAPEPGESRCPSVANNQFVASQSGRIGSYQSYIIIHELVYSQSHFKRRVEQ